jgi:hypothetical protein
MTLYKNIVFLRGSGNAMIVSVTNVSANGGNGSAKWQYAKNYLWLNQAQSLHRFSAFAA